MHVDTTHINVAGVRTHSNNSKRSRTSLSRVHSATPPQVYVTQLMYALPTFKRNMVFMSAVHCNVDEDETSFFRVLAWPASALRAFFVLTTDGSQALRNAFAYAFAQAAGLMPALAAANFATLSEIARLSIREVQTNHNDLHLAILRSFALHHRLCETHALKNLEGKIKGDTADAASKRRQIRAHFMALKQCSDDGRTDQAERYWHLIISVIASHSATAARSTDTFYRLIDDGYWLSCLLNRAGELRGRSAAGANETERDAAEREGSTASVLHVANGLIVPIPHSTTNLVEAEHSVYKHHIGKSQQRSTQFATMLHQLAERQRDLARDITQQMRGGRATTARISSVGRLRAH